MPWKWNHLNRERNIVNAQCAIIIEIVLPFGCTFHNFHRRKTKIMLKGIIKFKAYRSIITNIIVTAQLYGIISYKNFLVIFRPLYTIVSY